MDNLTFLFRKENQELFLDNQTFKVLDYEGLEASVYDIRTEKNVSHSGERITRKQVLAREIMVEFVYMEDADRVGMRERLIGFFSPYSGGTLFINYCGVERKIDYEISSFQFKSKNIHERLQAQLFVKCVDPDFIDTMATGEEISTWINGWSWKFRLPFKLKEHGETKKNIINTGHVETPVEIRFHGPAANPKIANLTTGEFIRVKKELKAGEILYISTAFRDKRVEIIRDSGVEDAFDYIDLDSIFFDLQVGDNVLEYSSESGIFPQSVEIYYCNRYIGV